MSTHLTPISTNTSSLESVESSAMSSIRLTASCLVRFSLERILLGLKAIGAEQPTKEQLATFFALLEEEGATETLLNIYARHPSDYQIQSYETGERAYIGVQMQL